MMELVVPAAKSSSWSNIRTRLISDVVTGKLDVHEAAVQRRRGSRYRSRLA